MFSYIDFIQYYHTLISYNVLIYIDFIQCYHTLISYNVLIHCFHTMFIIIYTFFIRHCSYFSADLFFLICNFLYNLFYYCIYLELYLEFSLRLFLFVLKTCLELSLIFFKGSA